jgi:hypothetical protein
VDDAAPDCNARAWSVVREEDSDTTRRRGFELRIPRTTEKTCESRRETLGKTERMFARRAKFVDLSGVMSVQCGGILLFYIIS